MTFTFSILCQTQDIVKDIIVCKSHASKTVNGPWLQFKLEQVTPGFVPTIEKM